MSILDAARQVLLIAILAMVPFVFLRVTAKLITKQDVNHNLAYLLTLAWCVPAFGIWIAASNFPDWTVWINLASLVVIFILLPGLLYGYFLKSAEGQAIGFVRGLVVALVQQIFTFIGVMAIFLAVEYARHGE